MAGADAAPAKTRFCPQPVAGAHIWRIRRFEPPLAAASRSTPFSTKHPSNFNTQHQNHGMLDDINRHVI